MLLLMIFSLVINFYGVIKKFLLLDVMQPPIQQVYFAAM